MNPVRKQSLDSDLISPQVSFNSGSTGYSASIFSASSSRTMSLKKKPRGRLSQWHRKTIVKKNAFDAKVKSVASDLLEANEGSVVKRKATEVNVIVSKIAKRCDVEVVLH